MPYWDFLGSTIVTSNYVRLTPDLQSKSGAIWNTAVSGPVSGSKSLPSTYRIKQ